MTQIEDYPVTVCAECLTASCWHGESMCQNARYADVKTMKRSELDALKREHADNYSRDKIAKVCGVIP